MNSMSLITVMNILESTWNSSHFFDVCLLKSERLRHYNFPSGQPVSSLTITVLSSSTVFILWDHPVGGGQQSYEIEVQAIGAPQVPVMEFTSSAGTRSRTVLSLAAGKQYAFTVRPIFENGIPGMDFTAAESTRATGKGISDKVQLNNFQDSSLLCLLLFSFSSDRPSTERHSEAAGRSLLYHMGGKCAYNIISTGIAQTMTRILLNSLSIIA